MLSRELDSANKRGKKSRVELRPSYVDVDVDVNVNVDVDVCVSAYLIHEKPSSIIIYGQEVAVQVRPHTPPYCIH